MKQREERRKTLARARMRSGAQWSDVCILNISSRGVGLQAASPPPAGSYVEIRRGTYVVVARVAWTRDHRFGARSQDPLAVDWLLADPSAAGRETDLAAPAATVERRKESRADKAAERSRMLGRSVEFASLAVLAAAAAATVHGMFESAVASPLSVVAVALGETSADNPR